MSSGQAKGTVGNPWAPGIGGEWLRGNLHCHTTNSDGRLSPQETVDWFAANGYQFMALTDHNRVTDPATVDSRGMCLLTSSEVTATGGELGASYHLITLGLRPDAALPPPTTSAAESLPRLAELGDGRSPVVFVAHPHWSGLTVADITGLPAGTVAGIEVFNGGTVLDSHKGEATIHWDEGLARGHTWWGIAVDDTHWHSIDRALGWVMVRAPERTPDAILNALSRGHFYASAGPEIRQILVTQEADALRVDVETSPCAIVYSLGYGTRNQFVADSAAITRGEKGATITSASFLVKRPPPPVSSPAPASKTPPRPFIRIQCTDWQHRSAWSNPIFL